MADVTYTRQDLQDAILDYVIIDDCCAGQRAVKHKGEVYLPFPNKSEYEAARADAAKKKRLETRYDNYILRANFINFTGRTKEGLSGLVFSKPPTVTVPDRMKIIVKNADGSGINLTQVAKNTVDNVVKKGRAGMFVDYPQTSGPVSLADIEKGDIRPVMLNYRPEAVINWDTAPRSGKVYLTLVVLQEQYRIRKPGDFEVKTETQYRVLELADPQTGQRVLERIPDNAVYRQQIWRKNEGGTWQGAAPIYPRDAQGKFLTEIPFTFIGATNNSPDVDKAPLIDLANLNLAHYRNSADHEESVFLVGQPTPWASGLTEDWIKTQMGGTIYLGSRGAILLPPNGQVGLIQADPNTYALEGMKQKFEEAQKLGAKFVENNGTMKTATEASQDNVSENSVLGDIANNAETAIKWCLEWGAIFTGDMTQDRDATDNTIKFELNKRFDITFLNANDRAQLLAEYQANVISFKEYRDNLRKSGLFLLDDDEAEKDIDKQMKENLDFEAERNKKLAADADKAKAGGTTNPSGRTSNV